MSLYLFVFLLECRVDLADLLRNNEQDSAESRLGSRHICTGRTFSCRFCHFSWKTIWDRHI